ncbi:DegQ family serine endoprotease [Echinimonas agarilytica]|uniref:DegQ family serine endoprotease n=1 Tax=Echinimonas agarilytica TaxID=1215918 RepID=A0AA42B6L8_9GAMM|nr:DegQ family serine endoprotease [Echinimonas agarilytica]MCM2678626.1 DegQ family serine endoprotease [Echinimonas agarilytica]
MKIRPLVSALVLSVSLAAPMTATAVLPVSVDGQSLPSLAPMLENVTPAVVNISVAGTQTQRQRVPEIFRQFGAPPEAVRERPFKGLGSGVIIDAKEGYVLTNHHVINEADEITVTLTDGRSFMATKIGSDEGTDVALLQIESDNLTAIKMGDSDILRVGDFAVAIGNPFGLGQTVTSGIVGALARSSLNIENYENFIQTDAAINSGNSGGALVNLNGELIGINTAIYGPNGGNVGIGFAIPVNMASNVLKQLLEHGEVHRGVLGVTGRDLNSEVAKAMDLEIQQGAFVNQVFPDTAAADAGIEAGDVITTINGKKVKSFGQLRAQIGTMGAGAEIELGLLRDGKNKTVSVKLGAAEEQALNAKDVHSRLAGATLVNASDNTKGVEISEIVKNSPAQRMGLRADDIIIGVNRVRVKSVKDLKDALDEQKGSTALQVIRGDARIYIFIR